MKNIIERLFKGWRHPAEDSQEQIAVNEEPLELMEIVPAPSQLLNSVTINICPAVRLPIGFKNNISVENPFSIRISLDQSNLYLSSKEKVAQAAVKLEDEGGTASEMLCTATVYEWSMRGLIGINLILTPFKAVEPLEVAGVQADTAITANGSALVEACLGYSPSEVPSHIETQYLWSLESGIPFLINHEGRKIEAYEAGSSQIVAVEFIEALSGEYSDVIHVPVTLSASSDQIELYTALSRVKSSYSFEWSELEDNTEDIIELLKRAVEDSIMDSSIGVEVVFENDSYTARLSKDEVAGEVTEIQVVILNKPNPSEMDLLGKLIYISRIKTLLPLTYAYEGESISDCQELEEELKPKVQAEIEAILNALDSKLYLSSLTALEGSCSISVEERNGSLSFKAELR